MPDLELNLPNQKRTLVSTKCPSNDDWSHTTVCFMYPPINLASQSSHPNVGLISNYQDIAFGVALCADVENQYIQFDKNALGKVQLSPTLAALGVSPNYPMPMINKETYASGHSQQGMWLQFQTIPSVGQFATVQQQEIIIYMPNRDPFTYKLPLHWSGQMIKVYAACWNNASLLIEINDLNLSEKKSKCPSTPSLDNSLEGFGLEEAQNFDNNEL